MSRLWAPAPIGPSRSLSTLVARPTPPRDGRLRIKPNPLANGLAVRVHSDFGVDEVPVGQVQRGVGVLHLGAGAVTPGPGPGRRRSRRFLGPAAGCWAWRCTGARPRRSVPLASWCRGKWRRGPVTHRAWPPTRRTGRLKPDLPVFESPSSSMYRYRRHPQLPCALG